MRLKIGLVIVLMSILLSGCFGLEPLTDLQAERLAQIGEFLEVLEEEYVFRQRRNLDWDDIRSQYRATAPFSERPNDFYHLLAGMLSELDDLHVSLDVPEENLIENGRPATSLLHVPGFYLMPIGGRPFVVGWPDGWAPSRPELVPANAPYAEVVRIEGFPALWPLVPNLLRGRPGSDAELHLRWHDGSMTRHTIPRPENDTVRGASGVLPEWTPGGLMAVQVRSHGPYVLLELSTLDNDRVDLSQVDDILNEAADSRGLILDLRRNLGGDWDLTGAIAGRFLENPVRFALSVKPSTTFFGIIPVDPFVFSDWSPRGERYTGPLVILTSALTGSGAEHLALVLQREIGARVIGEQTSGAEAGVKKFVGRDGSTLRFSAVRLLDVLGRGLQDSGVVPDISVRLTLDDVERLGPQEAVRDWERRLFAAAEEELAGD